MNGKQNLVKLESKFYVSGICVNVKLNLGPLLCRNTLTPQFALKLLICKRALRQLIPINFAIFLKTFLFCIIPYTPPVL